MLGFSPAFTRPGIWPKHCAASMYQLMGCEDRGGRSQGVGGNEWVEGWEGRMRWRGRACRSRGGGGRGKLGVLGAGAEVWDHGDMLSLGLEAEPGLLTSLLSVNICEQLLDMCVYCLLPSVSFCRKWPSSAVNFSRGEVCCGCRKVMLFQPARLDSPWFHLHLRTKRKVVFLQVKYCITKQTVKHLLVWK